VFKVGMRSSCVVWNGRVIDGTHIGLRHEGCMVTI
jgi:hypothetical protein